jgi:CheY-like chemotaxis protein
VTFTRLATQRTLELMRQSAAVLCQDNRSLQTLQATLDPLEIDLMNCHSGQNALELIMTGQCSTLIVDCDLDGAEKIIRMANLLPPAQKPALLAVASRAWPGTGQAFQSGAGRILYKPIDPELVKQSLAPRRKPRKRNRRESERYEVKTLVYLELPTGTVPGISIDIGEHGLAVQATESVPMISNLAFRCVLPGTKITLHGHADVIWSGDQGRAGLFFSKLSLAARQHLHEWLRKHGAYHKNKSGAHELLPPADAEVSFAAEAEELETVQ